MWPRKNKREKKDRSDKGNSSPSTVRCAQDLGVGVPPYKVEMKRKRRTI